MQLNPDPLEDTLALFELGPPEALTKAVLSLVDLKKEAGKSALFLAFDAHIFDPASLVEVLEVLHLK